MKDLEIRGAGNLLGGEQSGHIAGVGFDLYVRLVGEAVASFRGEGEEAPAEIKIELPVDAHLPHDYVPHERLRLEMYKKLAAVVDEQQLAEIEGELVDRYGPVPVPVRNLLEVARLRTVARAAGIADISVQGQHVRFGPVELRESQQLRLNRLYPKSILKAATGSVLVPAPKTAVVGGRPLRDQAVLDWASQVIRAVVMDNVGQAAQAATAPRPGMTDERTPRDHSGSPRRRGARPRRRARHRRLRDDRGRPGRHGRRPRHHRERGPGRPGPDQQDVPGGEPHERPGARPLIGAPVYLDEIAQQGVPVSESLARTAYQQQETFDGEAPADETLEVLRAQLAIQQLAQSGASVPTEALTQLKVDVNPRYGAFDASKLTEWDAVQSTAGLATSTPDWIKTVTTPQQ